ncbi:MAG TPA: hypothetical protein VH413_20765 [Verrucomicrobiae bacterium]|jgi:tetratricopeptide (TPR) repeat protein|nr:hypothetical protein [Verrucomicrobiae bacterium]
MTRPRHKAILIFFIAICAVFSASADDDTDALTHQHWYEARTQHFNLYSCGPTQEVYKAIARLEQFRDAYGLLAGAQVLTSPPITVIAFPDHASMRPFLPQYQGQAESLSGFFKRSSDENLIVLELAGTNSESLDTVYHEFTHLLLRRNDDIWPVWLEEGMAEIYSTFEAAGRTVRFGKPIEHHLWILHHEPLMPLKDLLAVTHTSPQYNEQSYQGMFYAESWLLTHYLMNGDNPIIKARFRDYTPLLRRGQSTIEAFTNALRLPLPAIEADFHRYLERGRFDPVIAPVSMDLSAPRQVATRPIGRVETCFRLGDELLRINRADAAEPFFAEAEKIAPNSPLPYEGLGMLALQREHSDEALRDLKTAVDKGSTSFLAHYLYAETKFHAQGDGQGRYTRLDPTIATEIHNELQRSIELMPTFGPSHELMGFFELVQGDELADAQQQLLRAIQLEPENQWYLISLAQVQLRSRDLDAARRTLEPLRLATTEPKLRERAEEEVTEIDRFQKRLNSGR